MTDLERWNAFAEWVNANPCTNQSTQGDSCGNCPNCCHALDLLHPDVAPHIADS